MQRPRILRAPEGVVSLFDQSLITATQDLSSIGAVLNFCASNASYNDSCSKAVELWKRTIARISKPKIVLQRGDLADTDWYDFIKLLAIGVLFNYCIRWDAFNDIYSANALPYAGVSEDKNLIPQDVYYFKFKIYAAPPRAGTQGYFMRMSMDSNTRKYKEIRDFVVGPDADRNLIIAAQILGEAFWKYHYDKLRITNGEFVTDGPNYHEDNGVRPAFPNKEFFIDRIIAAGINPATGRGFDVIWFIYFGDYVPGGNNNVTESSYDIIPITF